MSKATTQTLACTGLWTDPNPHANTPVGAMDVADNVVFRRPGTCELRPGFKQLSRGDLDGIADPDGVIAFGGDLIVQAHDEGLQRYSDAEQFVDEFDNQVEWPPNAVRGQPSGETLYFTATDSVRKLYVDTPRTVQVGVPVPHLEVLGDAAAGSSGAIQPLSYAAYVGTVQIVYADERTVTSGVTGRVVVYNSDATDTMSPAIRMYFPRGLDVSAPTTRVIASVYRMKNSTVYPPEPAFLAYRKELTAALIAFGSTLFTNGDDVQDADLGEALYTNPNIGTFARNNALAPRAQDLAIYAGSMFAARLTYPWRAQARFSRVGDGDRTGLATRVGYRSATCDVTDESADLTNVSDVTGLEVGMIAAVNLAQASSPGTPLLITAIVGDVVTLDRAITNGSASGRDVKFYDALHVAVDGAVEVFPLSTPQRGTQGFLQALMVGESATTMDDEEPWATPSERLRGVMIGDVERYDQATVDGGFMVNVRVEARNAEGVIQMRVAATHGDEFNPPLAVPTADADEWTAAERPYAEDSIAWSKNEEYEHFTEAGRRVIGTAGIPILRQHATVGGLWILKARGDGVYRLTGFGERTGWRVEQVSKTCALLHPNLSCGDGTNVFGWTNEGAVQFSAGGKRNLSAGVIGVDWREMERLLDYLDESTGAFALSNAKDNEIVWGLNDPNDPGTAAAMLVYNTLTQAWSKWFPDSNTYAAACSASCRISTGDTYGLICLLPDDGYARLERDVHRDYTALAPSVERADRDFSITVATVTGTSVTITAGDWVPAVGDIIVDNPNRFVVTAVASATAFTVDRAGLTTGGAGAFASYTGVVRWVADFGGGPDRLKRFEAVTLHCESTIGTHSVVISAQTPPKGTAQSQTLALAGGFAIHQDDSDHEYPEDVRCIPVPDAALGNRLRVEVSIRQADSRIRISGLTTQYKDANTLGTSP